MKDTIKKSILAGITFFLTISLCMITYSYVTTLGGKVATNPLTSSDWNSLVANVEETRLNIVPSGAVMAFNSNVCPSGWTKANGSSVPYGIGGSATLDLRGEFIRGWDDSRGVDAGRAFGTAQTDSDQKVSGYMRVASYASPVLTKPFVSSSAMTTYKDAGNPGPGQLDQFQINFDNSTSIRTSTETRPRNIAVLYCVKI